MERQLFLHHYLPSLYCSVVVIALLFDQITVNSKKAKDVILFLCAMASTGLFMLLNVFIYGLEITKNECQSRRLISSWDFDCNRTRE